MEVRAEYTEELINQATKRFWWRLIAWHGVAAIALGIVFDAYQFILVGPTLVTLLLSVVLALAIVVGAATYFVYRHRALATFRRMGSPRAVFNFNDDGMSSRSDLGGGEIAWRGISKVWVFPEVWLLFMAKGLYVTIPTNALTPEVKAFIRAKVQEHGGTVA